MKTVLIIGDSYGVPNYRDLYPEYKVTVNPDTHIEFLLRKNYKVYNASKNGAGNIEAIERAKDYLSGKSIEHPAVILNQEIQIDVANPKVDWCIWFHTEPFRNYKFNKKETLYQALYNSVKIQYDLFVDFVQTLECKTIVIGGQCKILPYLFEIHQPNYCIEDWKSLILNEQLPECYFLSDPKTWIENINDDNETKLKYIENYFIIIEKLKQSEEFPDNGHPGPKAHYWLYNQITHLIDNYR